MIKKLKRKFIAIATVCLACVMLAAAIAISLVNFTIVDSKLDRMLCTIVENGGRMPGFSKNAPSDANAKPKATLEGFDPETEFRTRFFSVRYDTSGTASADVSKIAALGADEALLYADKAVKSGRSTGFMDEYKYLVAEDDEGALVVFLYCESELDSARSLFMMAMLVALVITLTVFVLVLFISGKAIKPIAESYEKQKRFITDAGHELKTPLTIISSDIELVEMDNGQSEWTRAIKGQTARMTSLVSDLVLLAKLDEEENTPFMSFSLTEAVLDTASAFAGAAERRETTLQLDIADGVSLFGDEAAIRRLVSVLTDNAVKYCDRGGDIKVTLTGSRRPRLTVENSFAECGGLDCDRLFDRFWRADNSRARKTGGTGLGLSIARSTALAHGASLTASCREGRIFFVCVF